MLRSYRLTHLAFIGTLCFSAQLVLAAEERPINEQLAEIEKDQLEFKRLEGTINSINAAITALEKGSNFTERCKAIGLTKDAKASYDDVLKKLSPTSREFFMSTESANLASCVERIENWCEEWYLSKALSTAVPLHIAESLRGARDNIKRYESLVKLKQNRLVAKQAILEVKQQSDSNAADSKQVEKTASEKPARRTGSASHKTTR